MFCVFEIELRAVLMSTIKAKKWVIYHELCFGSYSNNEIDIYYLCQFFMVLHVESVLI